MQLVDASAHGYFENALAITHEWIEVAEEEGIPPPMPDYYDLVSRLSLDVGDVQNATRFARLALDGWTKINSVDDTDLETARAFMRVVNKVGRNEKLPKKGVPNKFKDK
jgi:hypothetical protein